VEASIDEATDWLRNFGLLDSDMSPEAIRRRHLALSGGEFGEDVTPEQRRRFLQALLPSENSIAAFQDDIGCLKDPRYEYKLDIANLTPIQ
jgi:hypothetical protein